MGQMGPLRTVSGSLTRRLSLAALVLALVLPVSQCSWLEAGSKPRVLKPGEIPPEKAAKDTWIERKTTSRADRQILAQDRLEAIADLSLLSRDYESSLFNYLQILQENPERHDLRYKVGVIYLLTGQAEAARQELATVLTQRPDLLEAHEALGLVHLQEKRYPLAIQEFQLVLAQDSRRAKTQYLLGATYLEAGQTPRAITELKKAEVLDPRQVSTYIALGQAYQQQKNYQQAVTMLKKGQSLEPQNQKVNHHLGMALAALKRYPEAMEAFLKAGDEAQAYNNIGVHYFLDGQYEEAAKCFQRALDLRPTFYHEAKINLQRSLEKLSQARKEEK